MLIYYLLIARYSKCNEGILNDVKQSQFLMAFPVMVINQGLGTCIKNSTAQRYIFIAPPI
jgi:hypothetical protein